MLQLTVLFLIKKLWIFKVKVNITVSIDSFVPETYSQIRKGAVLAKHSKY